MKKSIFLFFAAILCAIGMNAAVPSKLYLDASGWGYADARYAAYFMPQNSFVDMTKVTGEVSVFEVAVPASQTGVIFVRMNGSKPANDWANKWNQTGDLTIPTNGKNKFKPSGWDGATTTWSTYTYTPPTFYIAGDFVTPQWSENAAANKMDYADGVFSKSYDNVAASAHQFKITNGTWDNAVGYNSSTCSGTNCTVENGGGNIKFTPLAEGTVTITYTLADGKVHITCPEPPAAEHNITYPATQTNYTLVAGAVKAQAGAEVSFTATPADGYVLNVTYNGNAITGNNNAYTFTMPAADVTIAIEAVVATTIYYVDNNSWGNANAYMWNDSGNNGWPGVAMTSVGTVGENNYAYYSVSFAQGAYTSVIFSNNGSNQTADQTIDTAKPYFYDGKWYTWDELTAKLAAPVVDYDYYIAGPLAGGWSATQMGLEKVTEGQYACEFTKDAGDYQFKVTNGKWSNETGGFDCADVEGSYEEVSNVDGNVNVKLTATTTFTVKFDSNTKKISFEGLTTAAPAPTYDYYIAGPLAGGWNATQMGMEKVAEGQYTCEFTKDAGDYQFKVTNGKWGNETGGFDCADVEGSYEEVSNVDGNVNVKLTATTTFTVKFDSNTKKISFEGLTPAETKYYIAGTQNLTGFDWQVDGLKMTEDAGVYKHTFSALPAGTFEFKVTNGTWTNPWGYSNLSAAYEEVTEGTDGTNPNGNIKFVTEEAKNITVIFDPATGKITIDGLTEKVPVEKHYYLIGTFNEWTLADANYELTLDGEVYKKEVTFAADVQFKVNQGDWDASWGKDNLGGKTYAELDYTNDGNLKMKEEKTFTVIFNLGENLITFEGLTENAPVAPKCYLMGNGDWANGVEMEEDGEQFKLLCHHISAPFKFKYGETWSDAVENYDFPGIAWVDGNIVLPEGYYDFYFKTTTSQVYIAATQSHTRSVTEGNFGTICLPFGSNQYTGATFYEFVGKETGKAYLASVNALEAGVPYIFKATAAEVAVYSDGTTAATAGNSNGLYGTFTDNTEVAVGNYILYQNAICECNAICYVNANRAYIVWNEIPAGEPTRMPGRRYVSMGTQGTNATTGVDNIVVPEGQVLKVIENGQLIIIRGGEKFNVQGQKL